MAYITFPYGTAEPDCREDGYHLQGETDWMLRGTNEEIALAVQSLRGVCTQLNDMPAAILSFGNAVGYFTIPGIEGRVEVVSGKWKLADFERMLAEISDAAAGLPFAADAAASLPYDRTIVSQYDVLYHVFVYLRQILSPTAPREHQLLPALRIILQMPHQHFARTRRTVPIERVRRVDAISVAELVQGGQALLAAPAAHQSYRPLAHTLHGHLPETMSEQHIEITHDTAENRFVKAFLGQAEAIISGMLESARDRKRQDAFAGRLLDDCAWMAQALRPITQQHLWREVGPMVHLPASSPVLQERRGYKDVYRHFVRLRLAANVPLSEELVRDLLEAKDIAQLYEVWCFFALVREITHLRGTPTNASGPTVDDFGLSLPRGLEVSWPDGTRLQYNPGFSRSSRSGQLSYSVPLRPDIALNVPSGVHQGLHLFDAKFKLEKLSQFIPDETTEAEVEAVAREERRGTFKRGDLYKMHAYRDAIAGARSVWILYPGSEFRFFAHTGGKPAENPDELVPPIEGVGALPLRPTETHHVLLGRCIAHLLQHDL